MSDNEPPQLPSYPPNQPSPYGQPPKEGMSNKAQTWLGIALTIPLVLVMSLIGGALGALGNGSSASTTVAGAVIPLASMGVPIALLFSSRTRFIGVGLFIGYAVLLIVAAGACVVLLAALSSSH